MAQEDNNCVYVVEVQWFEEVETTLFGPFDTWTEAEEYADTFGMSRVRVNILHVNKIDGSVDENG